MASLHRYEGTPDQVHGHEFSGAPMGREQPVPAHTPDTRVGDIGHLEIPHSELDFSAMAACVTPAPHPNERHGSPPIGYYPGLRDVRVEYI